MTTQAAEQAPDNKVTLQQVLDACKEDRAVLQGQIETLMREIWHESLECLEQALPQHKTQGSADAKLFAAFRHRILNTGNRKVRDLPGILGCYAIRQLIERKLVEQHVTRREGIWGLPPGVQMPESKARTAD